MAITYEGYSDDSAGWNGSVTTSAGESLLWIAEGNNEGSPSIADAVSSVDGSADWWNLNTDTTGTVFLSAYWHSPTATTHSMSVTSESGIGESYSVFMRVKGLADGKSQPDLVDTSEVGSGTSHAMGSLTTTTAEALLVGFARHSASQGTVTQPTDWTLQHDGTADASFYRIVSSTGTYSPTHTTGIAVTSDNIIYAFYGPAAAGPTIPIFSHHYTKNIG